MRKSAELKTALESVESPGQTLALWDDWTGRTGDFWAMVAAENRFWNEDLVRCASLANVVGPLSKNTYLPLPLAKRLGLWMANRIVGDMVEDMRQNARGALHELIVTGRILEGDEAVTVLFNHLVRRPPRSVVSGADMMSLSLISLLKDLSTATIDQVIAATEHRPHSHPQGVILGYLKPYVFHQESSPARWLWGVRQILPPDPVPLVSRYTRGDRDVVESIMARPYVRRDPDVRRYVLQAVFGFSGESKVLPSAMPDWSVNVFALMIKDRLPDSPDLERAATARLNKAAKVSRIT